MGKSRLALVLLGAAVLGVAPALAQDNIEGPYGAVNGDIYGRARTVTPLLDWSSGMTRDWEIEMNGHAAGIDITMPRTYPVFDAAGNLYWLTSIAGSAAGKQYVASASPSGTVRWRSAEFLNPGPSAAANNGGVIVGQNAVYGFAGGAASVPAYDYDGDGNPGYAMAAFNKATGVKLWLLDIDGDWDNNGTIEDNVDFGKGGTHPLLYNGKLYVVGVGMFGTVVVQVNAATGAKEFFSVIDNGMVEAGMSGTLTLIPGIFSGADGLFFTVAAWSPSTVYGVRLDPTSGPQFQWFNFGGKLEGRTHVIYSPVTQYLYVHTWWDDGAGFRTYEPISGTLVDEIRAGNHGYVDVAALLWDDVTAAVGGFDGTVQLYTVDQQGQIVEPVPHYGGIRSWGEMHFFGQLARKDPNDMKGVLLTTGPSNGPAHGCINPDSDIVLLDLNRAEPPPGNPDYNGPAYIDDVQVLGGPDFNNLTVLESENFESPWVVGPISGQDPNWSDGESYGPTTPEIAADPTGGGMGQVLKLDAIEPGTWPAAVYSFSQVTTNVAVIRWRQFRVDISDDLWLQPRALDNRWGKENSWDGYAYAHDPWWEDSSRARMTPGAWETVELRIDQTNPSAAILTLYLNGATDPCFTGYPIAAVPTLDSMYWDLTGTAWPKVFDPPAMARFSTGNMSDIRSAAMGPDGKVYYQEVSTRKLVALKPAGVPVCRGDCNCDDFVDFNDINPFVKALSDLPGWQQQYPNCPLGNPDVNGDGHIDFGDINPFVAILSAGGGPCD